jgi:N-acetylmuramoyl-L-alanine amidase
MKIMLDAGHGYNTPGKRSPDGMREYDFNREVASEAKVLLEKYKGIIVYYAHSDERDVPLKERTDKANRFGVDCYVSIHANAYGTTWNNVRGIESFIYTTKPEEAFDLAEKVQKKLISVTGLPNRGVKTADFHVLRETKMTAILIECGFMTNREDCKLLRSAEYRKTCAEAIVQGIKEKYSLQLAHSSAADKTNERLYRVQIGAFSQKKNADALAEKLRKEGYDAIVVER